MERCLALEGQVGVSPGGRTGEASEKSFNMTTNLVGNKERQKKISLYGCSTCLIFGVMISHRNLLSFDFCAVNGARFSSETPRSQFGDCRCQGLSRVGEVRQDDDEDW